jgi:3-oxoacyl-[acyl-carrier protein] reductase
MDLQLADNVVLVTGASGGIGEGCRIVLAGNSGFDKMSSWLAEQPFQDRSLAVQADIRDPAAVDHLAAAAAARFGRLDVCVANAGIWPREDVPFHAMDPDRIRNTLDVNLLGSAWTARAFLAQLARTGPRKDGHGASLVFIGSTAGRFGERDHTDYSLAKAGLVGLTQSLKNEIVRLDPFGRVNLVEPGWTVTHMVRPSLDDPNVVKGVLATMALRQLGRAKDIARAVVGLSSPAQSRHITGQTLTVAGGMEGRRLWQSDEIDVPTVHARLREDDSA